MELRTKPRQKTPERRARIAENARRRYAADPEKFRAAMRRYMARSPLKARARARVQYALKTGRLTRPDTCSRCSSAGPIHAHHADHSKPLDVAWLCRSCHWSEHDREQSHLAGKPRTTAESNKATRAA